LLVVDGARSQGFAARFVSGYLYVAGDGSPGSEAGGATHAWAQIYLPRLGWVDCDPTTGAIGNRDLIRIACVRDPAQAAPLSGSYIGLADDFLGMSVEVAVTRADRAAPGPSLSRLALA
ncbi:MAG: transglutaminase family protein, partial [Methylobacteriaceae bacterium]|nr:transglutaminase family protein [Methylobacteriaceae bacterium]